jgi:hypothetical protein
MSSSTEQTEAYLNELNFTGGFPISSDLAPSIIFAIVVS